MKPLKFIVIMTFMTFFSLVIGAIGIKGLLSDEIASGILFILTSSSIVAAEVAVTLEALASLMNNLDDDMQDCKEKEIKGFK